MNNAHALELLQYFSRCLQRRSLEQTIGNLKRSLDREALVAFHREIGGRTLNWRISDKARPVVAEQLAIVSLCRSNRLLSFLAALVYGGFSVYQHV